MVNRLSVATAFKRIENRNINATIPGKNSREASVSSRLHQSKIHKTPTHNFRISIAPRYLVL